MRPTDEDVTDAFSWVIGRIDGTMKATGRTKWLYERGFNAISCGKQGGHDTFQFSWQASADGTKDPARAARAAAAYFESQGMEGPGAAEFRGLWAASFQDRSVGVFVRYIEEERATMEAVSPCYPGNANEAWTVLENLHDAGTLAYPTFFDPDAT